jgi:hypothetical protein
MDITRWYDAAMGRITALLLLALDGLASANGSVTPQNGNYYTWFDDVWFDDSPLKITRQYNSKSSFDGMFGFGWGSDYEVHLRVMCDGTVVVYENGGGAENMFVPQGVDLQPAIDRCVKSLVELARTKSYKSETELPTWKARIVSDARFRHDEEVQEGFDPPSAGTIPTGTIYTSERWGHQQMTRTSTGFARTSSEETDSFDEQGHLTSIASSDGGARIDAQTDKDGRVIRLADATGHWLELSYLQSKEGQHYVEKIKDSNGRTASYRYDGRALVWVRDSAGHETTYEWTKDGRYNLLRVGASSGTEIIRYNDMAHHESVSSFTSEDGTTSFYTYAAYDAAGRPTLTDSNALHFGTWIETVDATGAILHTQRLEYQQRIRSSGERYLWRFTEADDGNETSDEYDECCGRKVREEHGDEVQTWAYDADGRVAHETGLAGELTWTYHPNGKKATLVLHADERDARVEYDENGNITHAVLVKGPIRKAVWITYDADGNRKSVRTLRGDVVYRRNASGDELPISPRGQAILDYADEVLAVDPDNY